jgi:hypothetical protein
MTKKDLESIGVIYVGNAAYPKKFFVPHVGEVNLHEPYSFEEIFRMVYHSGYERGIKYGEDKKISEIKRVLQIEDGQ